MVTCVLYIANNLQQYSNIASIACMSERNTKTKMLVTQLFSMSQEPLSLQEVYSRVQKKLPATAHSTVYRIVMRLQEEGHIHAVDWRERGSRYEWAGLPHHHHVVCQLCGAVADLADTDVNYDEQKIRRKTGFIIKHHSIELEGICKDCQ